MAGVRSGVHAFGSMHSNVAPASLKTLSLVSESFVQVGLRQTTKPVAAARGLAYDGSPNHNYSLC